MCKAFDDMLEEERMEGREEGVAALVNTLREFGCSKEIIIDKLVEKLQLSELVAGQYVQKYWE